jgi:D-inositol-3-phosphate glycosyltransferase
VKFVLVGTAYPHRGGIAHYVALLSRELTACGHEVKVISFSRQYPSMLFPGKSQDEAGPEAIRVDSERLIDSVGPWSWFRAARRIGEIRPDLVVFKYWMPFFAPAYGTIARGARRRGIRTCFLLDNVIPHERRPGDLALTRYALGPVDTFIAQSKSVAEDLRRFRPEAPMLEVPHPVYSIFGAESERAAARARLGVTASEVALFFGFIRRYKGLANLLRAVALIPKERSFQLLIGGEFYEDEAATKGLIRELGIGDRVVMHDRYIANDEVADFFSAANVAVLPYVTATQSGIIQIAMNFNRPVITTDVGGLPEVVRAGVLGEVVPPEDPATLAAAIVDYFDRGKEAIYTPNMAREKERYSWGRLVEALETFARGEQARTAEAGAGGPGSGGGAAPR